MGRSIKNKCSVSKENRRRIDGRVTAKCYVYAYIMAVMNVKITKLSKKVNFACNMTIKDVNYKQSGTPCLVWQEGGRAGHEKRKRREKFPRMEDCVCRTSGCGNGVRSCSLRKEQSAGRAGRSVRTAGAGDEYQGGYPVGGDNSYPGPSAEPTEAPPEKKDSREILQELGIPIPEKEVDFEDLRENVNADIYAWIYIPDTMIDYPVLQHPTDNTYYLNYNLDGSKGYPGCIYTEDYNTKDFSDPNTVVYGHNMKNGSMFAGLHKYGDSKFMEEHPYVYIYTEDALYAYEVFAAYEHTNEHILYAHNNFSSKALFKTYLDEIMLIRDMGSVIKEDVEYTEDSRILTLSTCISVKPNNRYLVQGVLLNGE